MFLSPHKMSWTIYFHYGGPTRAWPLSLTIPHLTRMRCTTPSMTTAPRSHSRHLHPTPPFLAPSPARLATGARQDHGQDPPSLPRGSLPQYRLCPLECLQPTQVVRKRLPDSICAPWNPMFELVAISQLQETWRMSCAASGKARLSATHSSER